MKFVIPGQVAFMNPAIVPVQHICWLTFVLRMLHVTFFVVRKNHFPMHQSVWKQQVPMLATFLILLVHEPSGHVVLLPIHEMHVW